jgi:hypothetical protein
MSEISAGVMVGFCICTEEQVIALFSGTEAQCIFLLTSKLHLLMQRMSNLQGKPEHDLILLQTIQSFWH